VLICLRRRALHIVLAAFLLAGCSDAAKAPEEFRIGLLAPITQPARFTGHLLAQARVDEVNAKGGIEVGGRKVRVRLIVADSGGRVEQTMSAVTRLVQQERVCAIIGPYYSREAIPVAAALGAFRVPMVTPSATNPEVTRNRPFAFRVCQVDSEQGRTLARYAYEIMGLRRTAVLADESDTYCAGLGGYFREAFAAYPGAAVLFQGYASGTTNFGAQLKRILAFGAQALYLPNFTPDLTQQLQQARAAGFTGVFLGGDSWATDPAAYSLPEAQGAVFSSDFNPAAADPMKLKAAMLLAQKSGTEMSKNTALTLDALDLLLTAATRVSSTDPVSLRTGLATLSGFMGLTGPISFSGGGDPERAACIVGLSGGQETLLVRLEPKPKQQAKP